MVVIQSQGPSVSEMAYQYEPTRTNPETNACPGSSASGLDELNAVIKLKKSSVS